MTHDQIQQKLLALYDGPLTEKERALVEGHLSSCAACRRAVGEWKKISETLLPAPTFSEAEEDLFVAKVMARVETMEKVEPVSMKASLRWLFPLLGSAAAAAWVFFSVLSDTPGLASSPTIEYSLLADEPEVTASQWDILPETSPSGQIVQAFYRER